MKYKLFKKIFKFLNSENKKNNTFYKILIKKMCVFFKIDCYRYYSQPSQVEATIIESFEITGKMILPKIYNYINSTEFICSAGLAYALEISQAIVFPGSDLVIINKIAYWAKARHKLFFRVLPQDNNLLNYDRSCVYIKRSNLLNLEGVSVSLFGAHDSAWGHFISQYIPKLYTLVRRYKKDRINVLVHNNVDDHIRYILEHFQRSYQSFNIIYFESGVAVQCEKLISIDHLSYITDHSARTMLGDTVIPKFVFEITQRWVSEIRKNKNTKQFRKIYLRRDGARSPLNLMEIDQLMYKEGFEIVHPHLLTMDDKISIFNEARIICGPLSSGFVNVIFSQPGLKVVVLTNLERVLDPFLVSFADAAGVEFTCITGEDEKNGGSHSSTIYNIEEIENVISLSQNG